MAHLLGGAVAAPAPGHLACAGFALPRGDGGIPQDLVAVSGRPGIGDGNTADLHLHDDLAVLPDLKGRRDVLHRHAFDGRYRAYRNSAAAARETLARPNV